jgi:hypothetical protein
MQTIEITGATGTGPYDVYVCDTTLTYCVLVGTGINFPPNFLYTLVYPLDIVNSVIIKLIDSNGCEFLQLYNCPTPTPTPTPTLTPTPTNAQCNCIQFENPTAYPQFITYTQCDGTVFLGSINNGTTLYVCGKLPNAEDGVLFSVGIPCIDGGCNPIPPELSQTPTPTITPTITPSPSCDPLQTHPFQLAFSVSTTLYGNHTSSLTTACDAAICLNLGTCVSNASTLPYLNNSVPQVGDYWYSNNVGCIPTNSNGYFIRQVSGVWTVFEVVSGQIVSTPC